MTVSSNRVIYLVLAKTDIIIKTIKTINTGHTLYYSKYITLFKLQHLLIHKEQAIKRVYRLRQDRKVIANYIINKDIILEAILSNKTILRKFIASIIQLPTANNKQNAAYFTSKLYKNKRAAKKSKATNKRRRKDKKYTKEQSFYNNNSIII